MNKNSRDYEVCLCYHITRGDVEDFLAESGIRDLKTLCDQMPVGDKCGGCREDLDMIIQDLKAREADA
jgi:bacterioferritin-associated ferredoxin